MSGMRVWRTGARFRRRWAWEVSLDDDPLGLKVSGWAWTFYRAEYAAA